ncbi:fluoride efflux transporter CrcB [Oceanomicrobium pacificus]|uniref:Fluoride-specific ion channel FluC n=1 Tax=Oceanomicrobium pacificus TaxID=2692916 RepID=A0A6B0TP72_9RHOB|nr:fluoride efflux transporter CrcB [Oceanomicrobium pacificus]MXU66410.1 fluoride efflux transporter CrcB [Oceanomicrobium pacificus]
MPILLQVALGGAVGAALRYLSVAFMVRRLGTDFPHGTLFVNVVGSLAMGIVAGIVASRLELGSDRWAAFLMPGLLGGFTTFSAFSLDTVLLLEKGRFLHAGGYMIGSVILSVGALFAGLMMVRAVTP